MKKILTILTVLCCLYSCESSDDDVPDYPSQVIPTLLSTHTRGNGFTVIVMADGYTLSEIESGEYRSATTKAATALFDREPMASLQDYVDVLEVPIVSTESGITSSERDTRFKCYYDTRTTSVYANDSIVLREALIALQRIYGLTTTNSLENKLNSSVILVLLNCTAYKGVTYLAYSQSVTDSIPSGYSISFIPTNAYTSGRNVFNELVQHELVGHGIAKLADEYTNSDNTNSIPSSSVVDEFLEDQSYGLFQNVKYSRTASGPHAIESDSWIYPFAADTLYTSENVAWYQGAYTYYKRFFRPSENSIMNSTTNTANIHFNVASRAMIYKRIMREVNGSSWKFDYPTFISFDAAARDEISSDAASAKAAHVWGEAAASSVVDDQPVLTPPVIIRQ